MARSFSDESGVASSRLIANKDSALVGDDGVWLAVLVEICDGWRGADAAFVVDEMGNKRCLIGSAFQFKPIDPGCGVGFCVAVGAVNPEAFASDDVLQPIAVDVR